MTWHTKRNEVPASGGSFLPEDYLQRKAERRGLFISMFLFVVVAMGVVGAFFVTHRRWNDVKKEQERINSEYAAETIKIDQLKVHEKAAADVKEKAEVAVAIKEKVPRSILLAELINRMPEQLTLTDFTLKGKRYVEAPKPVAAASNKSNLSSRGQSAPSKPATPAEPPKPSAPRFEFTLSINGYAASDSEIADYVTSLHSCPLLDKVEMVSATEITVDEVQLRKFNIEAQIKRTADARMITPLQVPRLSGRPLSAGEHDPMDPTAPREEFDTTTTNKPAGAASAGGQE